MSSESPIEALQAITGLSTTQAAHLLEAADQDLAAAVNLHFSPTEQGIPEPTPIRQPPIQQPLLEHTAASDGLQQLRPVHLSGWDRILTNIRRCIGSIASSTVHELFAFIRGIFLPLETHSEASFATRFRTILPSDHPASDLVFLEPPISAALAVAITNGLPLILFGLDFPVLSRAGSCHTHFLEILASSEVISSLQEKAVLCGLPLDSSLASKLTARALGLTSPVSITCLLPMRLNNTVSARYRLILRGRSSISATHHSNTFPGLGPGDQGIRWSSDVQERIVEELQTKTITLLPGAADIGDHFGLELLRGGLLAVCKLPLNSTQNARSLLTAINCSDRLAEPIRVEAQNIDLRRQQDRELIARQQEEYEESLRADRKRAQERAERDKAEAEAARVQQQAEHMAQAERTRVIAEAAVFAQKLLNATCAHPDAPEQDFADISLRIAPTNERVRIRVHKEVMIDNLRQTLRVLDDLLKAPVSSLRISGAVEPEIPCCVRGIDQGPSKVFPSPLVSLENEFILISMGSGPLPSHETVGGCGLLPNAVVHLRPSSI